MIRKLRPILLFVVLSMITVACTSQQDESEVNDDLIEDVEFQDDQNELIEVPEITEESDQPDVLITEDERLKDDELVVIVNSEEVYGEMYNLVYYQVKSEWIQKSDPPIDLEVVHEETIEQLIKQTLLIQDARERGIVVTDREANAVYQDTKAQFETEEGFYETLDQLPYTEEVFRSILRHSLLEQYYIDQEFADITVDRDDIQQFYNILSDQMEEAPPLASIRADIERRILQTEIEAALNDRINQLILNADIQEIYNY